MTQVESSGQGETFVVDNENEEESTTHPTRESPIGKFQTFILDNLPQNGEQGSKNSKPRHFLNHKS